MTQAWTEPWSEGRVTLDPLGEPDPQRPDIYLRGTLKHGLHVIIRPLNPQDRAALREAFPHLSERSRYLRFLTGKGRLSETALSALVDRVDQQDHVALVMWWARRSRSDILLGDGRFIRLPDDPGCADVAVTMADEIQGRGAGTLMMLALVNRAHEVGITRFSAVMAPDNEASHRMMLRAGRVIRDEYADGLREVEVELHPPVTLPS
jgi:RimJ/RimL family protein N-acetyltransferase